MTPTRVEEAIEGRLAEFLEEHFAIGDEPTVTSVAAALDDLRSFKRELNARESELEAFLADILPGGGLAIPGVGLVEVKTGASKKRTDGRRLAQLVAARLSDELVDKETGEVPPLGVVCGRVAEELIVTAGLDNASHNWRSGELKRRGIEVGKYVESEGGKTSVVITKGAA